MKSDLPAKQLASGIVIGKVIITGLMITGLSMMLVAVWLATAGS